MGSRPRESPDGRRANPNPNPSPKSKPKPNPNPKPNPYPNPNPNPNQEGCRGTLVDCYLYCMDKHEALEVEALRQVAP